MAIRSNVLTLIAMTSQYIGAIYRKVNTHKIVFFILNSCQVVQKENWLPYNIIFPIPVARLT